VMQVGALASSPPCLEIPNCSLLLALWGGNRGSSSSGINLFDRLN
jgi:hypothetical protein